MTITPRKTRVTREWALRLLRDMRKGSFNPEIDLETYVAHVVKRVYTYCGEWINYSTPERLIADLRRLDVISFLEEEGKELTMQNRKSRRAA